MANIKVSIANCDECPHAKISRVYTPDCWDDVRKIHCKVMNKDVHDYLDWYDKSPIPSDCEAVV